MSKRIKRKRMEKTNNPPIALLLLANMNVGLFLLALVIGFTWREAALGALCVDAAVFLIWSTLYAIDAMEHPDTWPERGWEALPGQEMSLTELDISEIKAAGVDYEPRYLDGDEDVREDAAEIYEQRVKKSRPLVPGRDADLEINDSQKN